MHEVGDSGSQQCTSNTKLPASKEVTFMAKVRKRNRKNFQKIQKKAPSVTAMVAGGLGVPIREGVVGSSVCCLSNLYVEVLAP